MSESRTRPAASVITRTSSGKSQHMRGTQHLEACGHLGLRTIPAYAGNTRVSRLLPGLRWDHPRVCGEHCWHSAGFSLVVGSSPRVRGTQLLLRVLGRRAGIIPACAGNTRSPERTRACGRDHPRVCGEHSKLDVTVDEIEESSPRVRGTLQAVEARRAEQGIIPACAGNTMPEF